MSANQAPSLDAPQFSVVIPTYNRCGLVGRAIDSALRQDWPDLEVLVVDDASTDATETLVRRFFPGVHYIRQADNQGPGAARQRGIAEARNPWVVLLDDDDQLTPGALATVAAAVAQWPEAAAYPVLMFAHGNGAMPSPFRIVGLEDYAAEVVRGDWVAVLQRQRFLAEGLGYPPTRLGGESLLWWNVAQRYGLPAWNQRIATVGEDAPRRLTSFRQQVGHAEEHARLQEMMLDSFAGVLEAKCPAFVCKKHLGAAVYWLLAGKPQRATAHLEYVWTHGGRLQALGTWLLGLLPAVAVRGAFLAFRWLSCRRAAEPMGA